LESSTRCTFPSAGRPRRWRRCSLATWISCSTLSISAPQIRAGKVKLLAVTSRERSPMFPDAPTLIESGFPDFEVSGWTGVMTTGGTPQPVIARLEAELRRILSDRELVAAFEKPGMTASFAGAREFGEFLDAEIRRWAVTVKHSGAQAD